jgi:hypothetical protein
MVWASAVLFVKGLDPGRYVVFGEPEADRAQTSSPLPESPEVSPVALP